MPAGELSVREVVTATRETSVLDAAKLMRREHVGDIVVADYVGGHYVPVGMLTDRDVVLEVVALELEPADLTVGEIMTSNPATINETDGVFQSIRTMRAAGVRRAPVVDKEGGLTGIVSVDDLIDLLAGEMDELSELISRERRKEIHTRPANVVH